MNKVIAISKSTMRELIRGQILLSVLFFGAILVVVSAFFGSVTIGDQVRVIKDFGLFAVSIFCAAFAVIAGATLLNKELSRKTIYNILAKPVERYQFLLGKYIGMTATVGIIILLMITGLTAFAALFETKADLLLMQAGYFILLELVIVCAAAIFFSSVVVTPILSGMFTFGLFLAGRSSEHLLYFINSETATEPMKSGIKILYILLPHLDKLNISNEVVFGHAASIEALLWGSAYSLSYAICMLILANLIFKYREFN